MDVSACGTLRELRILKPGIAIELLHGVEVSGVSDVARGEQNNQSNSATGKIRLKKLSATSKPRCGARYCFFLCRSVIAIDSMVVGTLPRCKLSITPCVFRKDGFSQTTSKHRTKEKHVKLRWCAPDYMLRTLKIGFTTRVWLHSGAYTATVCSVRSRSCYQ